VDGGHGEFAFLATGWVTDESMTPRISPRLNCSCIPSRSSASPYNKELI
jgi:hypothetical protein